MPISCPQSRVSLTSVTIYWLASVTVKEIYKGESKVCFLILMPILCPQSRVSLTSVTIYWLVSVTAKEM